MYIDNCQELKFEEINAIDQVLYDEENIYIFKYFSSWEAMNTEWTMTQSFVAGTIQSNLEKFHLKKHYSWNIYIIFFINFSIDEKDKNFIESDKFCGKKYILSVDDIIDTTSVKYKIKKSIPIFSWFDFSSQGEVSSNENIIKTNIYEETNNSILARIFKNKNDIKNITEEINIQKFINELKEEYQNED